jgi:hypothetical protein
MSSTNGGGILQGVIAETSPGAASTVASTIVVKGLDRYDDMTIVAELIGATGGTLDIYLQGSWDGGANYYDWMHFAQLAAGAAAVKYISPQPPAATAPVAIGKGVTPLLAAATRVGGAPAPFMRAVYVAGASTVVGAAVSIQFFGFQRRL